MWKAPNKIPVLWLKALWIIIYLHLCSVLPAERWMDRRQHDKAVTRPPNQRLNDVYAPPVQHQRKDHLRKRQHHLDIHIWYCLHLPSKFWNRSGCKLRLLLLPQNTDKFWVRMFHICCRRYNCIPMCRRGLGWQYYCHNYEEMIRNGIIKQCKHNFSYYLR